MYSNKHNLTIYVHKTRPFFKYNRLNLFNLQKLILNN